MVSSGPSTAGAPSLKHRMKYSPLIDREYSTEHDPRFLDPNADDRPVPWASIGLACGLLAAGMLLLVLGVLHFTGHFTSEQGAGIGLTVLGSLTFIPGFYQSRIAYYTWRGFSEYSFHDIPHY